MLFWVFFLDDPEDFRLFHALHEIHSMICKILKHGLCHETDQIEMKETYISFDLADSF